MTFGSPILLRGVAKKDVPVTEINLSKVLEEMKLTREQFVDLCILLGCDYSTTINGLGMVGALKMIKEYGSIEEILEVIEKINTTEDKKKKLTYSESFLWKESREQFFNPEVIKSENIELVWKEPNYEGLREFLVKEKKFGEGRIDAAKERIEKGKNKKNQKRLDGFFTIKKTVSSVSNGSEKKVVKGKK